MTDIYQGAWPEDSEALANLVISGKAERPAIARLTEWPEIKEWIVHSVTAGASRSHIYLKTDTPTKFLTRWAKISVRCSNPDCNDRFPVIRKHRNGKQWSIHVSGPLNGHGGCAHRYETKKQTLWLYLVTKQAVRSPRVERARQDSRQNVWNFGNEACK